MSERSRQNGHLKGPQHVDQENLSPVNDVSQRPATSGANPFPQDGEGNEIDWREESNSCIGEEPLLGSRIEPILITLL